MCTNLLIEDFYMVLNCKVIRFARLRGNITHIEFIRPACTHGIHQVRHQQIRNQACIQAPGTNNDQIRAEDGLNRRRECRWIAGFDP